ncbi:MAG: CotH kinase family protein, partial [Bacteroides sp.]|nr:CotH kinase family protein [Bacteroides sp.]
MRRILLILFLAGLVHHIDLTAQLKFTEIIALNNNGEINPLTNTPGDWIEIHNSGSAEANISHYYLSDRSNAPFMWVFPENTIVPAHGYVLVWTDGSGDTLSGLHANFRLDVAGESLVLFSAKREFIDSITYPRMYEDVSYGLSESGEYLFFRNPTPGAANQNAQEFKVSGNVVFDLPAGIYQTARSISISPSNGAQGNIRYTTDGTEPGPDDPEFKGGLVASTNTVLRARLFSDGAEPGNVATASYIIHEDFKLPVISLATDPEGLWSDESGIYVTGTNGVTGNCSDVPRNWNMEWEKPMSMEYFDNEGHLGLQINAGMKIHGGCSRGFDMKSLGLIARSEYGNNIMNYPFFREKDIDQFKGLILRNGGNDFQYTFIRDAVEQATVSSVMDIDHQAYEPVHVYLNGEYWGIHNLREKVNEHWVTSNYGIPAENLDFLKNEWEVFAGTRDAWDNLTSFLEDNSLVFGAPYSIVEEQLDINSYQDYLINQLYIANRDWPGNNQKYYRDALNNSKWRFIMFDLEFSYGLYTFDPSINMFEFATKPDGTKWPNPAQSTLMIRRLLENEGFRDEFLAKYMMHLNTTYATDRVIGIIDSLQNQIYDEYPEHLARWRHQNMSGWESRVEELRRWARERPDHVWNNMRNFFSLGEIVNMSVEATGIYGSVTANSVDIPVEGFTGKYAAGSALNLRYNPNPGYRFSHWVINTGNSTTLTLIEKGSQWNYNDSNIWPGLQWTSSGFNDASWPSGPGILGYGDNNEASVLDYGPDSQNKTTSYYFRQNFDISDVSTFDSFEIGLLRDDGAVVYINGQEVVRDNMPSGDITHNTFSSSFAGGDEETTYYIFPVDPVYFVSGTNTIAVEVHQNSLTSSDLKFDLELKARSVDATADKEYSANPLKLNPGTDIKISAVTEPEQLELDLYINEIMATNIGAVLDEYGNDSDWIEIYNKGEAVDMAGLYLTDNLDNPTKWRIPAGSPGETTISSNGHLVFFADENPTLGPRHLAFRLNGNGESLGLSYMSGSNVVWIDSLTFTEQWANVSTGCFPDGTGPWVDLDHTPGAKNVEALVSVQPHQILEVSLFPNPASDLLNITVSSPDGSLKNQIDIHIYDLTGRRVLSEEKSVWGGRFTGQIDISILPEAVYILVLETPSG